MTKEYFLKRSYDIYGNKFSFINLPEKFTNKIKINVICPTHGKFSISVVNFLNGRGCKFCNKEKSIKRKTTEEFVKCARKVHGDKYDYSKVNYKNAKTKVCIICPEHGEFWQIPGSHLKGQGCPKCGYILRGNKNRSNVNQFIKKAKDVHGDRYDYSKSEYINDRTKVCIICPEHGEFWQKPNNHLKGQGCPKCAGKQKTFLEFKNEIIKKYGNIYDFSKAENEYKNLTTKITVGYNKKFFKIAPTKLLHGNNNNNNNNNNIPIRKEHVFTTEDFVQKAKEVHGNKYDYSKVEYINTKTPVCIICPEHGEFWQTPNEHLNGSGCKNCNKQNKRSQIERFVSDILKKENINFKEEYSPNFLNEKFSHQRLDFYLEDYKIGIECQGGQHFKDSKKYGLCEKHIERDIKKYKKCKEIGIKIFYLLERHVKMSDIVNNEKYKYIYSKDNTFKNIYCLLENIDNYGK